MLDHDINNHIHNSIFIFIILKCRLQVMLLPMTHITFRYISLFFSHSNRLNCINLEQAKHSITTWDTDLYLFLLQIGTVK